MMSRSLRALAYRAYFFVWLGSLLSNIGNWMENVGQGWVVTSQTHSPFFVELLSFSQFLPVIFLALPAGIIADKFNRKKVLMVAQACMCAIATTLAVLAHKNMATPTVVIVITFFEGAAWALNAPAWQTVIPHLVPRKDLDSAIAMNSIQYNLARLVGPAIAGYVVHRFGFAYAFDLNALSFIAVLLAIGFVKFDGRPNAPLAGSSTGMAQGHDKKNQEARSFKNAWHWVWSHPGPKRIIISIGLFAILSAPIQGLMPFFASDVLHVGPKGFGILLAFLGGGAVTGAFLLGQLPLYYPRSHLIPLSIILLGIFELCYSQAPSTSLTYGLLYVAGIFWLWTLVSCNTAMQLLVPDAIRGRAMSILLVAHIGMLPFGHMIAGLVSNYIGSRQTILITSTLLIVVGAITLAKRVPEIDGLSVVSKKVKISNFFSEIILASSHRAAALALDRSPQ